MGVLLRPPRGSRTDLLLLIYDIPLRQIAPHFDGFATCALPPLHTLNVKVHISAEGE